MKNLPKVLFVDYDEQRLNTFKTNFRNVMRIYIARSCADAREILDRNEIQVLVSPAGTHEMPGSMSLQESVRLCPKPIRLLLGQNNEAPEYFHIPELSYPVRCLQASYNEAQLIEAVYEASEQYRAINEISAVVEEEADHFEHIINSLKDRLRLKRALIRNLIDQG